jgi:undecaprenyl-diphosphatase
MLLLPLLHVVVLAALQGLAEALPISRSGLGAVARLWLEPGGSAAGLEAVLHLGTALALGFACRRRLFSVLGEGVRAIARPALFRASPGARDAALLALGCLVSLSFSAIVSPLVEPFREAPSAAGLGLILTGLALSSTLLAPRPSEAWRRMVARRARAEAPGAWGMLLVGLGHGLAIFPGASRVGTALVLLIWLGVRAPRAVDLAFLLTIPSLLIAFFQGSSGRPGGLGLDTGAVIMGLILAFVAAILASAALRTLLDRRRLGALALWIIPLGLAMLAYSRSLPT